LAKGKQVSENPEIALVFGKRGDRPTYGRAYFRLVTELQQRQIPFLNLTATDPIPACVGVVITTRTESWSVKHSRIVIYDEADPNERVTEVVDRAIQIARGKKVYDELVIGVDPGDRIGVAAVVDGKIWRVRCCLSLGEASSVMDGILRDVEARRKIVRVGANSRSNQDDLISALNKTLSQNVVLEEVPEESTTRGAMHGRSRRRGIRDIYSAIEISTRKGRSIRRGF
jgi:hypothetical protein